MVPTAGRRSARPDALRGPGLRVVHSSYRPFDHPEEEWGYLACRVGDSIYVNTVGTFGVGSAGYWWGRLAGIIMRCTMSLLFYNEVWSTLFGDDLKLSALRAETMFFILLNTISCQTCLETFRKYFLRNQNHTK